MAISKIILNGVTQMDLTGDTVAASNLIAPNTAHGADGNAIVGTATGGADMPTFTVTWDSDYTQILSVTCDKTYAEVSSYFQNGKNSGLVNETNDGVSFYTLAANMDEPTGTDFTYFVLVNSTVDSYDLVYHSNGTITATFPSSHYETLNITSNGTYQPSASLGIINEVNVNVPSSGSSSWTKVAETSYQVSTTSTSVADVGTLTTGHSEIWTSSKWVYVRIRDTAGKRNGYHYGTDQFFFNTLPANSSSGTSTTVSVRICIRYSDNAFTISAATGTSGYGVYADQITSSGNIRIRSKYNSTNSLTINGTYKVEVYILNTPDGVPIFN